MSPGVLEKRFSVYNSGLHKKCKEFCVLWYGTNFVYRLASLVVHSHAESDWPGQEHTGHSGSLALLPGPPLLPLCLQD